MSTMTFGGTGQFAKVGSADVGEARRQGEVRACSTRFAP